MALSLAIGRRHQAHLPSCLDAGALRCQTARMSEDPARRFDVALEDLERGVNVPAQEQTEELPESEPHPSSWAWDEERRQARLAGGA